MKVTREDTQTREVTLTIDLDDTDTEPYLQRGYKRVVQRVNIPGFRKGKAPRTLVERYVTKDALLRETIEDLIDETVDKAVKDQSIDAYAAPSVDLERFNPPLIKAKVPLEPSVDLGDYKAMRLPLNVEPVTDESVNEVVERLRRDTAPWEPVDRPIAEGDRVTLDIHGAVEGKDVLDEHNVEYIVTAGSGVPLPGFSEKLAGLVKGTTNHFDVPVPAESANTEVAGKTCHFEVTVHEIKARVLPEINDDFARSVGTGEHENLEALRANMRQRLADESERQARATLRDQALNKLVEDAKIDLAPLIVDREVDRLVADQEQALRERRIPVEDYLKQVGKTAEQLREELRPRALERVKRAVVLRRFAEVEGIKVTDEDVGREIGFMGGTEGGASLARAFNTPGGHLSLANIILSRKVLVRLGEIVTQPPVADAAATAPTGEAAPPAEAEQAPPQSAQSA